jgi:hypothetical protein
MSQKFTAFYKEKISISYPQKQTIRTYPNTDLFNPQPLV